MKGFIELSAICSALLCFNAPAALVRYVDLNCTNPVAPYTNWLTAATNIQDAVNNFSVPGSIVLVTNGIYQYGGDSFNGSNRVDVSGITVQSVNGPAVTTILGYQVPGTTNGLNAVRCVYLHEFAMLSGFTLTGGATRGSQGGGGVVLESQCVISNCIITGNASDINGAGISSVNNGLVVNCIITGNTVLYGGGQGGGVSGCTLNNCVVSSNNATHGGGVYNCTANNCLFAGNGNTNITDGGAADFATLNNCTLAGNFSHGLGAAEACKLNNSIIYYNTNNNGYADCYQCQLTNCCTTIGLGNSTVPNNSISNAPVFVDMTHGNYRLQIGSPGMDAGTNVFAPAGTDLDGNPRIVGGTVDMGAYENQNTNPVHYVILSNSVPVSPFTNWLTAATNIQDAIDASVAGDFVVVSNGTYNVGGRVVYGIATNRVTIDKVMTMQSLNGAASTVIVGSHTSPGTRCVYLTNGAVLCGFTLTNGGTSLSGNQVQGQSGGNAWCEDGTAIISNCVMAGGSATFYGGGAFQGTLYNCILTNNSAALFGGGAASNTLFNCTLTHNVASANNNFGGGAYGCVMSNCLIIGNQALAGGGSGGGAAFSTLTSCVVSSNNAAFGGGLYFGTASNSLLLTNRALSLGGGACSNTLVNCVLQNNFASGNGGGAYNSALLNCTVVSNAAIFLPATVNGGGVYGGSASNCLLNYNSCSGNGGGAFSNVMFDCVIRNNSSSGNGAGASGSVLVNCTVVSNSTPNGSGGGGGINGGSASNSIIYYNSSAKGSNFLNIQQMYYCCTAPLPSGGFGNITNQPGFVDLPNGDLHLQSNSACINSGNNSYVTTSTDFDGNPRIAGGTVDIGAYEFQSPASIISYAYLQQYGLPTDGSADNLDSDGDHMNNWQEWKAGTNPTDATSLLQLASPSNSVSGVTVTWQSVTNVIYYLQCSTNLPAFTCIQSNIVGQAGSTSYTDTTATNNVPYFYRVGVQ
jgi:hypothetical protein